MRAQLIGVRIVSALREPNRGDAGFAGHQLCDRAHLIAERRAWKLRLECKIGIEFAGGMNDFLLDREDVPQCRIALIRVRLREFCVAQKLRCIRQCDGAHALPGQGPHVARANHHAIGREGAGRGRDGKSARKPATIEIFIAF